MLANASGKIVAKASVTDLKSYNRSSSQKNAEIRPVVADNAGDRQRRRVDDDLRQSTESTVPPRDKLPVDYSCASTANPAVDAA